MEWAGNVALMSGGASRPQDIARHRAGSRARVLVCHRDGARAAPVGECAGSGVWVTGHAVNGSGCGLGHPAAATGARVVVSMIPERHRRGGTIGCVAMGAGGGMGSAMVLERV